jgi:sec-independent protein translocase protein TatA
MYDRKRSPGAIQLNGHNQQTYNMKLNPMLALFNLGGTEIILILALVLILFGAKKLPELAKGLGTGIKEFKKATGNTSEEVRPDKQDVVERPQTDKNL